MFEIVAMCLNWRPLIVATRLCSGSVEGELTIACELNDGLKLASCSVHIENQEIASSGGFPANDKSNNGLEGSSPAAIDQSAPPVLVNELHIPAAQRKRKKKRPKKFE